MASLLKKHLTVFQTLITGAMILEVSVLLGLALWPAALLWLAVVDATAGWAQPWRVLAACLAATFGYFVFGFAQLLLLPVARWLTGAVGTPVGRYPYASYKGYRWASYNALTLIVRFSFINWIRATPFIAWYHRAMGMKVGRRVQINTAVVADQNLVSVGDDSVIGGDVTLIAHSVERGDIVTAPVRIGARVTVGLMAVILPGCDIGDDAVIAAGAVLPKGTRVAPGEVWGGVPARKVGQRQ